VRLENKIALITGGYGGMGRASAKLFAQEGATVFVTGRSQERGDALVAEINGAGGKAFFVELDVVNQDQWNAAVAQVKQQAGALHILMNIVGSNAMVRFPKVDIDEWNKIFETNVTATVRAIQTCAPLMKESGGGSIINIGRWPVLREILGLDILRRNGLSRDCLDRRRTSTPTGASARTSSSPAGSKLT
jgi:NAD(P)-dependent dehydrogenase (short-subunit alcohol dehydrogenase family)